MSGALALIDEGKNMQHPRRRFTLLWAIFALGLAPAAHATTPALPTITSVVAASAPDTPITTAPAGTLVLINGQNFGASAGHVAIAQILATVGSWSDTKIQATVPKAPSYPHQGLVIVSTQAAVAAVGVQFTITAPPPPPPSTTMTIGSWQVTTFSAIGTSAAITEGGALFFNGPNGALTSEPSIVPNIYAPNPAPVSLGTLMAGQNTTITAAVEGLPAADGSRVIQCYGFANTGAPGAPHAVQATVDVDPNGKVSVKWTDLNPAGAYSSQIYGASLAGEVGQVIPSKGQPPNPYMWYASGPSHAKPKSGTGSGAQGPSFWDPVSNIPAQPNLPNGAFGAVNDSGEAVANQLTIILGSSGPLTNLTAFAWENAWTISQLITLRGLGGSFVSANAINNLGVIVGTAGISEGPVHAVVWPGADKAPLNLNPSSASNSFAYGINDANDVVAFDSATGRVYVSYNFFNTSGTPSNQAPTLVPGVGAAFGQGVGIINNSGAVAGVVPTLSFGPNPAVTLPLGPGLPAAQATALANALQPCLDEINKFVAKLGPQGVYPNSDTVLAVTYGEAANLLRFAIRDLTGAPVQGVSSGGAVNLLRSFRNRMLNHKPFTNGPNPDSEKQWIAQAGLVIVALDGSL
jgi:IPT/TIG domain-containing protein